MGGGNASDSTKVDWIASRPMSTGGPTIQVVRGALDDRRSQQILRFWGDQGALDEEAARERLPEVVCVALEDSGDLVGVNSAYEEIPQPLGRPVWAYRSFLAEDSDELEQRMFESAFDALEAEFQPSRGGPMGVCMLISDEAEIVRRPEAIWPEEGLIFAGYLADGTQVRVRWFWEATAEPGLPNSLTLDQSMAMDWSIDERYTVEPYRGDPETTDEILAIWARERAVLPEEEARRRVHEALNVVKDHDAGVVAVSTAYLRRNPQLDMNLWYFRTFVSSPHRNTHVATQLTIHNRDLLERRFLSGEDTRAGGVCFELQNRGMRKYLNTAIWQPVDFIFIGENEDGVPVRVHYFPGARVPLPQKTAR
jgi:hypothetical protein